MGEEIHVTIVVCIEPFVINNIMVQHRQAALLCYFHKPLLRVLLIQLVWIFALDIPDVLAVDEQIQKAIPVEIHPICMPCRAAVFRNT